jgi:hypothetical protein
LDGIIPKTAVDAIVLHDGGISAGANRLRKKDETAVAIAIERRRG